MKTTGYIINGVYVKSSDLSEQGPQIPAGQLTNSTYKVYSHDQQRLNHARDLIQPYTRDGKPNPEFIQQYPDEARGHGFIGDV